MWLASLLSSGVASFGRLFLVSLLPNSIPIIFLWMLLQAGSFAGQSDWRLLSLADLKVDALGLLLFLLLIVVVAAILQPFQTRAVRLLEGYWEGWRITARIAPLFVEMQRRRLEDSLDRAEDLRELIRTPVDLRASLADIARQRKMQARAAAELARLSVRIQRYPGDQQVMPENGVREKKEQIPLLPTALGNALRTAETSAGERYGLDTIDSWPRMYPYFSARFAAGYSSIRGAIDAAAGLTISFLVVTVLGLAALFDEPKAYWIPACSLVLCILSYIGAVAAAADHITFTRVAYDLHRFDMLAAMHYALPKNPSDEVEIFKALSAFFGSEKSGRVAHGLASRHQDLSKYPYYHAESSNKVEVGDGSS